MIRCRPKGYLSLRFAWTWQRLNLTKQLHSPITTTISTLYQFSFYPTGITTNPIIINRFSSNLRSIIEAFWLLGGVKLRCTSHVIPGSDNEIPLGREESSGKHNCRWWIGRSSKSLFQWQGAYYVLRHQSCDVRYCTNWAYQAIRSYGVLPWLYETRIHENSFNHDQHCRCYLLPWIKAATSPHPQSPR